MDRNKVLELAREGGLVHQWQTDGEKHDILKKLERFAPLVEREVRGGMSQDNVFELMLTAGCSKYCDPKHPELEGFIVNDSVLDRIVALIEREVRGDAEPVAWMYEWDGKKHLTFTDQRPIEQSHPHFNKSAPLYTHPAPAASAESVASVHIKDGCLIGSQRKSGVDIPDGQYALYPIGTFPAPAVDAEPDANRYRWLKENSARISWNPARFNEHIVDGFAAFGTGYLGYNFEQALDLAMESALAAVKDNGL